jgi:hypothetical protein
MEKKMVGKEIKPIEDHQLTPEYLKSHRKTTKTDGEGNLMAVDDPAYLNDEGQFHKVRRKPTNFTPKKKKRKK